MTPVGQDPLLPQFRAWALSSISEVHVLSVRLSCIPKQHGVQLLFETFHATVA